MSGQNRDGIQFGRTRIEYMVKRRDRRTLTITVNPAGEVLILAPRGTRAAVIRSRLAAKAGWVLQKQDEARRYQRPLKKTLRSGEGLLYLGRTYQIKIGRSAHKAEPSVRMMAGQFQLQLRSDAEARDLLMGWYRRRAQVQLQAVVDKYSRRLGVRVQQVQIYNMRTRWGSASRDGRLRFNWRIVMAPRPLVEYVAAHEVCHIKHQAHSPAFWRMLSRVMPDYQQRREALAKLGPELSF